ncbi:BnaC03g71320D [Brassica napus]|uniref:mannan endo-1,4-beta-mannosidase n=1 Tax=Brassica napus TaxID=3708 RepID=A0A078J998_BRANA|nr:BnaC03g71320D [Brassica napus]
MDLQQEQEACWKLELDKVTKLDPSKKKKKKKKKLFIREDATYDSEPDYGYAELLSRVFDMLREEEVSTERPRTVMMRRPQLLAQGTQITVCLDFAHLCTTIHRKPGHVIKFLLGQMETKGWLNKQHQLEMKGLVSSQHFQAVFQRYIAAAKVQTQLSRRTMVFPLSAVRCIDQRTESPVNMELINFKSHVLGGALSHVLQVSYLSVLELGTFVSLALFVLCSAVFMILTQHKALANSHGVNSEEEWEMVQRKGQQFTLNGQPFYVNGFNTYWMMTLAADNSTRGKVTDVFQQASAVGLTVGRTWAFNDGQWRALQKSPSVYDEDVFKKKKRRKEKKERKNECAWSSWIKTAWESCGIWSNHEKEEPLKVRAAEKDQTASLEEIQQDVIFGFLMGEICELVEHMCDVWEINKKPDRWKRESSGVMRKLETKGADEPVTKEEWDEFVKYTVLNRVNTFTNITYKNDPTIFAWELMNEPRCPSDPSGDKLQSWIQEMAVFVKSLDAKHMVEIGLEGFYGPSAPARTKFNPNPYAAQVGTDFIRNNQALGVDFASVHVYPDAWISPAVSDTFLEFTNSWMQAHVEDAETYLGMPVLFTEFGVSAHDPGFNTSFRDMMLNTVYKMTLNSTRKGGAGAGSLVWQVFPQGAEFMDDGYAVYLTRAHTASKIISLQSKRLAIFNSLCGWRCKWGCKKKNHTALDALVSHDDEL